MDDPRCTKITAMDTKPYKMSMLFSYRFIISAALIDVPELAPGKPVCLGIPSFSCRSLLRNVQHMSLLMLHYCSEAKSFIAYVTCRASFCCKSQNLLPSWVQNNTQL